ncbi:uncharacterized protein LOC129724676 [Wyeomyia smithii]|uniref:uncharacterized protein LOC129724676 n=1 Tax=Wyeomyia smithii TaxID=174621 RepID=UPI002467F4E5|nr:uncharacterized protein LOC129724676 [Wyeomyia smithii]XP_055535734.1 uncharacterized protein LOC129724676 [Wyeomyia smithii]XP_055535735.1 uncharacterized protein LOC129724676 [Wyeomyia smithii]
MHWLAWCVLIGSLQPGFSDNTLATNETLLELYEGSSFREGRYFPFYTIGRIANVPCLATNGLTGTCLIRGECSDNGGLFGGSCSTLTNQATCCLFSQTCGGTTRLNSTYFTNAGYPGSLNDGGSCIFTIYPCSAAVCQLRIDFRSLTLAQPDGDGNCITDILTITGGSSDVPGICGENSGQHVYVNFDDLNPITIRVATTAATSFNRQWNLQLSQIACASQFRAPEGCLQYYFDTSGTISSFNYGFGANPSLNVVGAVGSRQIVNQQYGICIRAGPDQCSITYSLPDNGGQYAFTVSGAADALDPALIGMGAFGQNGLDCLTDYIVIPSPIVTDQAAAGQVFTDRFCGLGIYSVTSQVKPFVVYVFWDDNEDPDAANRGFRLAYSQNDCSVV